MAMHKLASIINNLSKHHPSLRPKFGGLEERAINLYNEWINKAKECESNAIGMACRNSMFRYANMMEVLQQGSNRGPPEWGTESNARGRLQLVFIKAEMPYLHSGGGLRHLGVIQEAAKYLDERSKRGKAPGHRYKAVTGSAAPKSRPKRKA